MAFRTPTRADDETLLAMLAERHGGAASSDIGSPRGLSSARVRHVTNTVRAADEKHEGCDLSHAYW